MTEYAADLVDETLQRRARTLRADIESGALRGGELLAVLRDVPFVDRDAWTDEVLGFAAPPPDVQLPRGSVPYLPCGVDEIMAMVEAVPLRPTDEVVDLGSGLGRVVVLAHLLAGMKACGIEIQEHLVASARATAAALGLSAVSFVHANAADAVLDGSVFFLFAPFNGEMLANVVRRLEDLAQERSFVVCTVGIELDAPWLRRRVASHRTLVIYDTITR
ncbi:MAG TPA: methyltransferase domain-containing protein [Kofleriaceae bacterium]|nr:methyltransferase domain-containing protein [Kofleriaceae bacterium]